MRGPAGAFLMVAIEMLVGTFVLMWVTMLIYEAVSRGHYRAATWVLWPLMGAFSFLMPEPQRSLGLACAFLMLLFLTAVYSARPLLEWITGAAASAAGVWLTVSSGLHSCTPSCGVVGAVHAIAGLIFLGAVTHGMVLGHWYLNQPRLPLEPLKGATRAMLASIALPLLVGIVTRPAILKGIVPGGLLFISSATFWWVWLLLMTATTVLAGMIRSTVWIRSTQSATGLFYIAMVPALAGQFLLALLVAT